MINIRQQEQLKNKAVESFTASKGTIYTAPESNADHHVLNAFDQPFPVPYPGSELEFLVTNTFNRVSDVGQQVLNIPKSYGPTNSDERVRDAFGLRQPKKEPETTTNEPAPIEEKSLNSNGVQVHAVDLPEIIAEDLGDPVLKTVAAPTSEDSELEIRLNALGDGYNVQEEIRRLKENDGHRFGNEHDQTYYKQAQYNIVGRLQAENSVKPNGIADADTIALIDQRLAENGITIKTLPAENTVQNFEEYQSHLREIITPHTDDGTVVFGDRGVIVTNIQAALSRINPKYANILNENGGVDGIFGPKTLEAIQTWQEDHGFDVTGAITAEQFNDMQSQAANVWVTHSKSVSHEVDLSNINENEMRENIVASASAHVGKLEIGGNNLGPHVDGFMDGHEGQGLPWCAGFVSEVMEEAAPYATDRTTSAKGFMRQAREHGSFHDVGDGYMPKEGDIIVFERGKTGDDTGHVGIVKSVNENGTITTIEGNIQVKNGVGGVGEKTYDLNNLEGKRVLGFANPVEMHAARNPEQEIKVAAAPQAPEAPTL